MQFALADTKFPDVGTQNIIFFIIFLTVTLNIISQLH